MFEDQAAILGNVLTILAHVAESALQFHRDIEREGLATVKPEEVRQDPSRATAGRYDRNLGSLSRPVS